MISSVRYPASFGGAPVQSALRIVSEDGKCHLPKRRFAYAADVRVIHRRPRSCRSGQARDVELRQSLAIRGHSDGVTRVSLSSRTSRHDLKSNPARTRDPRYRLQDWWRPHTRRYTRAAARFPSPGRLRGRRWPTPEIFSLYPP
jgi:hypothetical protein